MFPNWGCGRDEVLGGHCPDLWVLATGAAPRLALAYRVAEPDGDMIFGNVGITRDANDDREKTVKFHKIAALPRLHQTTPVRATKRGAVERPAHNRSSKYSVPPSPVRCIGG